VQIYLPIAELPVNILMLLGMSMAVGFISGMFGVGGFLMTPLLIFVGIPPAIVVATSASQIVATSTTGALLYWRRKAVDFKMGAVLLAGGLLGTLLGVLFFNSMRRIGQLETVIAVSYVVLLWSVGGLMLVESVKAIVASRRGQSTPRRRAGRHAWYEGLPLKMRFQRSGLYISVLPLLFFSVLIGFAGAVLGIGGGFILVPMLLYVFRVPTIVVVGTSLFQVLFTMIAATILHAATNQSVDIILAIFLIIGGVVGAQFGVRAAVGLRAETFRFLLAILILGVGLRFAQDILSRPNEPFSATATETPR
jgi:uncharacterized membrane protein YfcA